mgnify:CR=1 FL=1
MNESVYATKLQLLASLLAVGASFAKDDPLIKKALTDNEMDIRINGAKLLGKAGFDYVYDIYEHAYDDIKAKIIGYYTACKEAIFLDFFLGKARTEAREVRAELVDYFGAIKSPKAEPFLLEELDSALSSTDVRSDTDFILKVIRALAECGTFKSIEILYSITNIGIKRDAEAAIAIRRLQEPLPTRPLRQVQLDEDEWPEFDPLPVDDDAPLVAKPLTPPDPED